MLPEIKIDISHKDRLLKSITKTTEKKNIIKSLEEFQLEANAALTQLIEELGEASGDHNVANGDEDGEDDDEAKDNKNKDNRDTNGTEVDARDRDPNMKDKRSKRNEQNGESKPKKKKRCGEGN